MTTAGDLLAALWSEAGGPAGALERAQLPGQGNGLPSSFRIGALGQASIGASALAASELLRLRTGRHATVTVPLDAAMAAFHSERLLRLDGGPAPELWDEIAGNYSCRCGGWVRLHTNFAHHRAGVISLLGCADTREAVTDAMAQTDAETFEAEASRRGLVVAMMRSPEEWARHPQGAAEMAAPTLTFERIGAAEPMALPPAERPLDGIRVLEFTRIIAGPVAGRELASHGAEVLAISAAHLPQIEVLVMDGNRGKRAAHLDLRQAADARQLRSLIASADVFLQSYRPGGLAALGFGPGDIAEIRPGIVHATLSAYGESGPWGAKRGFDSLVQLTSGLGYAEAEAAGADPWSNGPKALPAQALDHGAGYLLAFAVQRALAHRAREGGSWRVAVSLAGIAQRLARLGRAAEGFTAAVPDPAAFLEDIQSDFGRLTAVRPAARIEGSDPRLDLPSAPPGTHPAAWL